MTHPDKDAGQRERALNKRIEDQRVEIARKDARIAELEAALAESQAAEEGALMMLANPAPVSLSQAAQVLLDSLGNDPKNAPVEIAPWVRAMNAGAQASGLDLVGEEVMAIIRAALAAMKGE